MFWIQNLENYIIYSVLNHEIFNITLLYKVNKIKKNKICIWESILFTQSFFLEIIFCKHLKRFFLFCEFWYCDFHCFKGRGNTVKHVSVAGPGILKRGGGGWQNSWVLGIVLTRTLCFCSESRE